MNDRPTDPEADQRQQTGAMVADSLLARALRRAWWTILWERLWPALASLSVAIGIFLSASWAGLWLVLPPMGRAIALFVLIVQQHDGYNAQLFFAGVAHGHFALQVLKKAVGKTIKSSLAPRVLLVASAAVGTDEFDGVLLRIAVQSRPTGAAHAYRFHVSPVHWSTSFRIHVHNAYDALGSNFDTHC